MNVKLIGKHEKDSRACRDALALPLKEMMAEDPSIVYVDCDLMGCINTKQLVAAYPERALQAGIAEGNAAGVAALVSSVLSGAAPLAAMQQNGGTVPALSTTGGFGATAGPSLAGVSASVAEGVGRCVGTVLFFDAAPLRRGCTVAIPSAGDTAIAARAIAFEVENVTTMPDWTRPDFWAGSAGACLGAVDFSTTAGASLPISRTPSTPFVGIVLYASRSLASLGTYSPAALTLPISY